MITLAASDRRDDPGTLRFVLTVACAMLACRSSRPARRERPQRNSWRPGLEQLEDRLVPSGAQPPASAAPIELSGSVSGTLASAAQVDWYEIETADSGLFRVTGPTEEARLALHGPGGELLISAAAAAGTAAALAQHLRPGAYYLAVSTAAAETALAYTFATTFQAALPPFQKLAVGKDPSASVAADLNGDGKLDIVVANGGPRTSTEPGQNDVAVLLGIGDGTFAPPQRFRAGGDPTAVAAADVDGDRLLDLVTANFATNDVSVLLGNGDGTFQPARGFRAGTGPRGLAVADIDRDGRADLVVAGTSGVNVLLGEGEGRFGTAQRFAANRNPRAVVLSDVDDDGRLDALVANLSSNDISLLRGHGDGTFQPAVSFPAGAAPRLLTMADVDRDGRPDVLAANRDGVAVLRADGSGGFAAPASVPLEFAPSALAAADVSGDGVVDLLLGDDFQANDTVALLLGKGDGSFRPAGSFPAGTPPSSMLLEDVNGDRRLDLLVAGGESLFVVPGNGDGTFQPVQRFLAGDGPAAVAVGDVNADGKPDVVIGNALHEGTVSVLTGNGDGTLQPVRSFPAGVFPAALALEDVNGDRKLDLIVAAAGVFKAPTPDDPTHERDSGISVLLGNGDGTFQPFRSFAAGDGLIGLAAADVNADGILDLLVPNFYSDDVSVLLGKRDGTFQPPQHHPAGAGPVSVAAEDVNGDGRIDLVVATRTSDDIAVLLGNGDATFQPARSFPAGRGPTAVTVADVNADRAPDVLALNQDTDTLSVLLGRGDGRFEGLEQYVAGRQPFALVVQDLDGDSQLDVAVAGVDGVTLLRGGDGIFELAESVAAGGEPRALATADVDGDGRPDLVAGNNDSGDVSVLLNQGALSFRPTTPAARAPLRDTPRLADIDRDGLADLVSLNGSGQLLFRQGLSAAADAFAPYVVINDGAPPARDFTLVGLVSGKIGIAAADLQDNDVSVYAIGLGPVIAFERVASFTVSPVPTRLAADDLDGDGREDLITTSALEHRVTLARQTAAGKFVVMTTLPAGIAPADIALLAGPDGPDILIASQVSGDVSILRNERGHAFASQDRYHAGAGPFDTTPDGASVLSGAETNDVVAADFFTPGVVDLVAVNRGAHSFALLPHASQGRFAAPVVGPNHVTSAEPVQALAHDVNGDGRPDLAILMRDVGEVWVYLSRPDRTFAAPIRSRAGSDPSGFSAASAGGKSVLLVGNDFGDVLRLIGDGSGRFDIDRSRLRDVPLAVADLNGDGLADVVVADPQTDTVSVYFRRPGSEDFGTPLPVDTATLETPLLAPGAVHLVQLDRGEHANLVVADSLGNRVLVYHSRGDGRFDDPVAYDVGDDPASVDVIGLGDTKDLNGDGVADLVVANHGSNDASVLLGAIDADTGLWSARPGPRLASSGQGPIAATAEDVNGDDVPDLLVTNSDGTIAQLPGIGAEGDGSGFFLDAGVVTTALGQPVAQVLTVPRASLPDTTPPPPPTPGQPPPPLPTRALLVAGPQGIARYQPDVPGGRFQTLFSGNVVSFDSAGPRGFVAVLADRRIGFIAPDVNGNLALVASATLEDAAALPSALEVLGSGDDMEVYVTARGPDGEALPPEILTTADFRPIVVGDVSRGATETVATPLEGLPGVAALVPVLVAAPLADAPPALPTAVAAASETEALTRSGLLQPKPESPTESLTLTSAVAGALTPVLLPGLAVTTAAVDGADGSEAEVPDDIGELFSSERSDSDVVEPTARPAGRDGLTAWASFQMGLEQALESEAQGAATAELGDEMWEESNPLPWLRRAAAARAPKTRPLPPPAPAAGASTPLIDLELPGRELEAPPERVPPREPVRAPGGAVPDADQEQSVLTTWLPLLGLALPLACAPRGAAAGTRLRMRRTDGADED